MTTSRSERPRWTANPPGAVTGRSAGSRPGDAAAIDWEDCVAAAAADIWGAENIALAALDVAGAAFLPALTIIEDAAWTLAQRHGWHVPEDWYFVALRACHLTHRQPGHRDQPQDLADWFDRDVAAAYWSLLPEEHCGVCGTTHKAPCPRPRRKRAVAAPKLTSAQAGQLRLDVITG